MKLLLFTLFVASVSAGSFKAGNVKCTFGPTYWCENYKQAKECSAVPYCQERVWKLKVKSNETCIVCQDAIKAVKTLLENKDIDNQLVGYLEMACTEFGSLAAECKALVEQYAPLIFQELEQLLSNPKQICTELGLCSASKEKVMATLLMKAIPLKLKAFAVPKVKKVGASVKCVICEFVADKLDQILSNNATQQEIEAALEKVCGYLPSSISEECDNFIKEYGPEILQILSQELNPKVICTSLGLCGSSSVKPVKSSKKKHVKGEACAICTTAMTYLKNLLQDNSTEKEIIQALLQVCNYLPSQIASECTAIVNEYGLEILKLIAGSDPKALCTEIGLCTSKGKLFKTRAVKDKCYLGASYWCASRANAVACKAVSFCTKHAW